MTWPGRFGRVPAPQGRPSPQDVRLTEPRLKIAVFVDFDNIEIGVKTTLGIPFDIGAILEAIKERGEVVTKIAYGDWKRAAGDHGRQLSQHAIRMVQRNLTPGGDKNGADINLALDALEMAFTHDHINAFVIVGGDSDFITLVEKLKQYDKKVFVVGGRQFTSLVMQKNCHEFIAYEHLLGARRASGSGSGRSRASTGPTTADAAKALPLVKRALKVLADREVTPQLGLLKSTLLQLDSTFSERDYGANTFRDFIERFAERGLVTLKQAGRSVLVELASGRATEEVPELTPDVASVTAEISEGPAEAAAAETPSGEEKEAERRGPDPAQAQDAVAHASRLFADAGQPPRWPMYVRQVRQYLRGVDEAFDERRFGFSGIVEFVRACQREGLLRLERDRVGVLRVFPGASFPRPAGAPPAETVEAARAHVELQPADPLVPEPPVEVVDEPPVIEAEAVPARRADEDEDLSVGPGNVATPDNEPKPGRSRRTPPRKAATTPRPAARSGARKSGATRSTRKKVG